MNFTESAQNQKELIVMYHSTAVSSNEICFPGLSLDRHDKRERSVKALPVANVMLCLTQFGPRLLSRWHREYR